MAYPLKHVRAMPTPHAVQSCYRSVAVNCVHALTAFPPSLAVRVSDIQDLSIVGPLKGAFGMAKKSLFIGYPLKHVRAIATSYAG
ncbi:hypothetical protein [Shewanella woodyi]|uniref:hypothetical protein n=1 Tax=Shewanella woodyi TaxID=60961 RepID=UPI0037482D3D